MREILFRGKRIDNGEWVYGSLLDEYIHHKGFLTIVQSGCVFFKVIPETVGQYTGKIDRKGVKIFEGDVVSSSYFQNFVVEFWKYQWSFTSEHTQHTFNTASHTFNITGNIHDK